MTFPMLRKDNKQRTKITVLQQLLTFTKQAEYEMIVSAIENYCSTYMYLWMLDFI